MTLPFIPQIATRPDGFIDKISVKGLFGHLDYNLDLTGGGEINDNRLAILYGDNGCGKTTLLRLLFHLLSPVNNRGHKTVLLETKFENLCVELCGGTEICVFRPKNKVVGNMTFTLSKHGNLLEKRVVNVNEDGEVLFDEDERTAFFDKFLSSLSQLGVELFFLRDNRRLTSSLDDSHANEKDDNSLQLRLAARRTVNSNTGISSSVLSAIENVNSYFRRIALAARNRSEEDINKVYGDVVSNLVHSKKTAVEDASKPLELLIAQLQSLATRNQPFIDLGLSAELPAKNMIRDLKEAPDFAKLSLLSVIRPYVESVQARLDALDGAQRLISQFVSAINSFLAVPKCVTFSLYEGLLIKGFQDEVLDPHVLSSGERQLLTIFCQILRPRDRVTIFIIDEPEISLNVKWQRKLLQSLLDCTVGAPTQFLLASHSVEMLSRHRKHVVVMGGRGKK